MLPTAVSVNLRSVEDCDSLLGGVAEWPVTVADLPANACGDFFAWWEAVVTPETLAALNLELFGVGVIAPEARSVASVIEWAARLQDSMKFIIALNHCGRNASPASARGCLSSVSRRASDGTLARPFDRARSKYRLSTPVSSSLSRGHELCPRSQRRIALSLCSTAAASRPGRVPCTTSGEKYYNNKTNTIGIRLGK